MSRRTRGAGVAGIARDAGAANQPQQPDALPMPVFLDYLRRLHDGPPQRAAAVRVAMALWQQAAERGDPTQAQEALQLARGELDALIRELTELQETGRRWSGRPTPTHADLEAARTAAAEWEAASVKSAGGSGQ